MTEAEWLTEADPHRLFNFVWRQCRLFFSEPFPTPVRPWQRKLRLLACACCRLEWSP
jgi:hypothetical protein